MEVSVVDVQRLLDVVASAGSKLMPLCIGGYVVESEQQAAPLNGDGLEPPRPGVAWSKQLQQLLRLQSLHLFFSFVAHASAMGLTALTSLTKLCLRKAGPGVDNAVVMALCVSSTGLRDLDVRAAGLCRAPDVFAAVGILTGLKRLSVMQMDALVVTDADLTLLHPMTRLESCCPPHRLKHQCSAEALSVLFAALVSPEMKHAH